MKSNVEFLSLAEELQFYILRLLPYQDILRCTSVCKALRQTYVSSSELQYIVELSGQHLLPNTDGLTPNSQRLQLLRDRAHAWLNFDVHSSKTITMPEMPYDQGTFSTDGHFYLWDGAYNSAMIIPMLSKPSQQTIERSWSPGTLCTVPHSGKLEVLMDPAQNLLAVVYMGYDEPETLYIDLKELDSDSVHPLAAGRTLFVSKVPKHNDDDHIGTRDTTLKGCGRRIAFQHLCLVSGKDEDNGDFSEYISQL